MKNLLRGWFGKGTNGQSPVAIAPRQPQGPPLPEPFARPSLGLQQFFQHLGRSENLRILDLSGASQANLNFVLQYGHHLYCENVLATIEDVFGTADDALQRQADGQLSAQFLQDTFANLQGPFDGALVWDTLSYLQPPLLDHVVGHLHRLLEPGAYVFAFFPSDERARWQLVANYRIEAANAMNVVPKRVIPAVKPHSSRSLERLFSDFASVKFFLTRDHMRELLIRR